MLPSSGSAYHRAVGCPSAWGESSIGTTYFSRNQGVPLSMSQIYSANGVPADRVVAADAFLRRVPEEEDDEEEDEEKQGEDDEEEDEGEGYSE